MKEYFKILRKCSLFNDIDDGDFAELLNCLGATIKEFSKKEIIVSEGESTRNIGIVISGAVQIEQTDFFGNRSIVASVLPSELFGETFACAGVETVPVDVVSVENTKIMFLDCVRITQSCSNSCLFHRQIIYNLMKVVAIKNLMFHQKIEITSKRSTREKLITYLLLQAKKNNSNSFKISYNRQELADYLEVDRSGLSAEISKMKKEGLIDCNKNNFLLLHSCL